MLAQKDPYIEKTVTRVKKLTEDEKLRMIAEARQDQIMRETPKVYVDLQADVR